MRAITSIVLATRIGCGGCGSFFRTCTKQVWEKIRRRRNGQRQELSQSVKLIIWIVFIFCPETKALHDGHRHGPGQSEKTVGLDIYLCGASIVGRMSAGTVAAAATTGARHNLIRAARLPLLVALQMGTIVNSQFIYAQQDKKTIVNKTQELGRANCSSSSVLQQPS